MAGLWKKDGNLICNSSHTDLIKCDECPCDSGGGDVGYCNVMSYVDGWVHDEPQSVGWVSKTYTIGSFKQTVYIEEGNIGVSGFTCPTKTKSIRGSLSVTFESSIDECSLNIDMYVSTSGSPVWNSPRIVQANGSRTASASFTVAWGTGDNGDGYYLSWT